MSTVLRKHCDAKRFYHYCSPAFNKGFTTTVLWPGSCPVLNQKELKYLAITAPFPHPLMSPNTARPSLRHAPQEPPQQLLPSLAHSAQNAEQVLLGELVNHTQRSPVCFSPPGNHSSTSPQICVFEQNIQEAEGGGEKGTFGVKGPG